MSTDRIDRIDVILIDAELSYALRVRTPGTARCPQVSLIQILLTAHVSVQFYCKGTVVCKNPHSGFNDGLIVGDAFSARRELQPIVLLHNNCASSTQSLA